MSNQRIAIFFTLLISCVPSQPAESSDVKKAKRAIGVKNEATLTEIRTSRVPQDYEEKINAALDEVLKDPTSKLVEFTSTPIGSLVCGKLNAKNSYGGYTGKAPFYAYFKQDGSLGGLEIDLKGSSLWDYCKTVECYYYPHVVLSKRCTEPASQ